MDLSESENLKEIPDLSMAINLEKLLLRRCSSLVEINSSMRHLHKVSVLDMSQCTELETFPSGVNLKSLDRLNLSGGSRLKSFPDISNNISWLNLNRTAVEEFPSVLCLGNLKNLQMKEIKSRKLWEGEQSLPCLTTIDLSGSKNLKEIPNLSLATNLDWMNLGGCSNLVKVRSSSIRNLKKLTCLSMEDCKNLELLPTDINLESLECLNLNGCSRLRSFPNISHNIRFLSLNQTAIVEVPSWINDFRRLQCLRMRDCKDAVYIALEESSMMRLKEVDFSNTLHQYENNWLHQYEPMVPDEKKIRALMIAFVQMVANEKKNPRAPRKAHENKKRVQCYVKRCVATDRICYGKDSV